MALSTGFWVAGGILAPGDSDSWEQLISEPTVKWFTVYNNNNPGRPHHLIISAVSTRRAADGNSFIQVTIKNIGPEFSFYKVFYAQTP